MSNNKKHSLEVHELLTAIQAVKGSGLPINSMNIAAEAGVEPSLILANSEFMQLLNDAAADEQQDFQSFSETSEVMTLDNLGKFLSPGSTNQIDVSQTPEQGNGEPKQSDHQSVLSVFSALEATNRNTSFDTSDDQSITIPPDQGAQFGRMSRQFENAQSSFAEPATEDLSGETTNGLPQIPPGAEESTSVATFRSPPSSRNNNAQGLTPPVEPMQSQSFSGSGEQQQGDMVESQKLEIDSKNEQIQLLSSKLDEVCASLVGMQIEKQGLYHHLADIESLNRNLVARVTQLESQIQSKVSQEGDAIPTQLDEGSKLGQLSDQIQSLEAKIESTNAALEGRLKDAEEAIRSQPTKDGEKKPEVTGEDLETIKVQLVNHFKRSSAAIENVNVSLHKRIRDLENKAKGGSSKGRSKKDSGETENEVSDLPQELTPEFESIVREEVKNEISKLSQDLTPEIETTVREEVKKEISKRTQELTPEIESTVREEVKNEISKRSLELKSEIEIVVKDEVLKRSLELTTEVGAIVKEEVGKGRDELAKRSEELTSDVDAVRSELALTKNELLQRAEELSSGLEAVKADVGSVKNEVSQSAQQMTSGIEAVTTEFELVKDELAQELSTGFETVRAEVETVRAEVETAKDKLSKTTKEVTSDLELMKEEVVIVKTAFSQSVQKLASSLETVKGEVGTVRGELSQSTQDLASDLETLKGEVGIAKDGIALSAQALTSSLKVVSDEVEKAKQEISQSAQELAMRLEVASGEVGIVKNELAQSTQEMTAGLEAVRGEIGSVKNDLSETAQELTSGLGTTSEEIRTAKDEMSKSAVELKSSLDSVRADVEAVKNDVSQSTEKLTASLESVNEEVGVVKNELSQSAAKLTSNLESVKEEVDVVKNELSQSAEKVVADLELLRGEIGTSKSVFSQSTQDLTSSVESLRTEIGTVKEELSQRSVVLESGLEAAKKEIGDTKTDLLQRSQDLNTNIEKVNSELVTAQDWVKQRFHESESALEGVLEEINRLSDVGQELGTGLDAAKADLQSLRALLLERTSSLVRSIESLIEEMATTEHGVFEKTEELTVENNQFKEKLRKFEENHDNLKLEILSHEMSLKKPLEKLRQAVAAIELHEDGTTVRELNARVTELQTVLAALNDGGESASSKTE